MSDTQRMPQRGRGIVTAIAAVLACACGSSTATTSASNTPTPTGTHTAGTPTSQTTAGASATTLTFAGDRSGLLQNVSVHCNQPVGPDTQATKITVNGTIASDQYSIDIDPAKASGHSVAVWAIPPASWATDSMAGLSNADVARGANVSATLLPNQDTGATGAARADLRVTGTIVCP